MTTVIELNVDTAQDRTTIRLKIKTLTVNIL